MPIGPWSIIYVCTNDEYSIYQCGPFDTRKLAIKYADEHRFTGKANQTEYEFEIDVDRVYLIGPDHKMMELAGSDFDPMFE